MAKKYIDADKLKAEIERLKKDNEISEDKDYAQYELDVACGYDGALDDVLGILSTLESEKPMNPSEHRDLCGLRGPSGVDGDKNWYLPDQEIIDWCGKFSPSIREKIQSTAYHFADWQKEQMMKEAVEGVVEDVGVNYIDLIDFDAEKLGLIEGDKVRIIVIPNTDKK